MMHITVNKKASDWGRRSVSETEPGESGYTSAFSLKKKKNYELFNRCSHLYGVERLVSSGDRRGTLNHLTRANRLWFDEYRRHFTACFEEAQVWGSVCISREGKWETENINPGLPSDLIIVKAWELQEILGHFCHYFICLQGLKSSEMGIMWSHDWSWWR